MKGLTTRHWWICIGFGILTYVFNIIIKLIPDSISSEVISFLIFILQSFNKETKISDSQILDIKKNTESRKKNAALHTSKIVKKYASQKSGQVSTNLKAEIKVEIKMSSGSHRAPQKSRDDRSESNSIFIKADNNDDKFPLPLKIK